MEVSGSLELLGFVGDALTQRGEAGEQGVSLVLLALPELAVGAMEPVQHAQDPETLVEPEEGTQEHEASSSTMTTRGCWSVVVLWYL